MASGLDVPDNDYVTAGMIQAQQDAYLLQLLNTSILASAILNNAKKTNELVNKALKLIYFEDGEQEVSKEDVDIMKNFRNMAFKIDTSSLPIEQDKLIRKK